MGGCCGPKCSKAFVIFFNILFWFSGCAMVFLGVLLLYDRMYGFLFTMLTGDMLPPVILQYTAFGFILLGGIILFVGFFGCCGALQDSKCMLGTYVFFLILVFLVEAAGALIGLYGFLYFPPHIRSDVQMKLTNEYGIQQLGSPVYITEALDFVQYEFECCGIEGRSDWEHSRWMNKTTASRPQERQRTYGAPAKRQRVPNTCCIVDKSIWREQDDPWNSPQPKNEDKCQGQDIIDHDDYAHIHGCWDKMMAWFTLMSIIILPTAGGLALLQIIGVVFSICLMRNIGEEA